MFKYFNCHSVHCACAPNEYLIGGMITFLTFNDFKSEVISNLRDYLEAVSASKIFRNPQKYSENPQKSPKSEILHFPHVCRRYIRSARPDKGPDLVIFHFKAKNIPSLECI